MTRVTLYTTSNSEWGNKTKEFLHENDVRFEEVDLLKHPGRVKELEEKTGKREVPVIDVDGVFVVGFEPEQIARLLKI